MTTAAVLSDLLKSRASCRGFCSDPVPQDTIAQVLADAQHVPSWCNAQPWQVIVCGAAQTDDLRTALQDHITTAAPAPDIPFPERYEGAYQDRRRTCGWQLYAAVGVEKGDRAGSARQMMENFRLFGAPHVLIVTTPRALGPYGVLDCGAFVTATLLGFEARGLGAIAMASVASYAPFLRDWFRIPEGRDVVCAIAFGHPDTDHPANQFRTERADQADVVTWRF